MSNHHKRQLFTVPTLIARPLQAPTIMRVTSLIVALVIASIDGSFALVSPVQNARPTSTQLMMSASDNAESTLSRRTLLSSAAVGALMVATPKSASARLEAVNRPDLLPKEEGLNVIQTETFLTKGQAKRLNDLLTALERDTGFRVRVLCQAYPNTPGLAIRDYWSLGKVRV